MSEQRKMKFVTKYSAYRIDDNGKLKPFEQFYSSYPALQNYANKEALLNEIAMDAKYHHENIAIVEVVRYMWNDDE